MTMHREMLVLVLAAAIMLVLAALNVIVERIIEKQGPRQPDEWDDEL